MLNKTPFALASTHQPGGRYYQSNPCCEPYISVNYHRNGNPNKSQWLSSFSTHQEYIAFCAALKHHWLDSNANLWAVQPKMSVMGTRGEKLALFLRPQSGNPWHGYPISSRSMRESWRYRPPKSVVDSWLKERLISREQASRIRRLKI